MKRLSASKNIASATTSNLTHSRPSWRLYPHRTQRPQRHDTPSPLRLVPLPRPQQRHRDALRRWKNKINTRLSAQCYPRHACPLHGSVLMQVHLVRKTN
ncbi:hypothetical protein D3H39_11800 [Citrobacter portucalensis]|nr:hypothetical protein D3H39_11800 [Citrobacter portucalensis]